MAWYYKEGDQEVGPLSKAELQDLIHAGKVTGRTLARTGEGSQWCPLADFAKKNPPATEGVVGSPLPREDATPPPSPPAQPITVSYEQVGTAVCSLCNRSFPDDQVLRFEGKVICAACKPMFVQRLKEGVSIGMNYAGFWIRLGAKIIDGLITGVVNIVVAIPLGIMASGEGGAAMALAVFQQLVGLLIPVLYNTWFVGRFAATPGKMTCGLRVVTAEGGKVSYARGLGRSFAELLSGIILAIGYIMAGFDAEKRALHDRICGTRVVYK